jgi:hypothetical protein
MDYKSLLNENQYKFVCKLFKESYDVLKVPYGQMTIDNFK